MAEGFDNLHIAVQDAIAAGTGWRFDHLDIEIVISELAKRGFVIVKREAWTDGPKKA